MTLSQLAKRRYTTKAYDDSRRIGEADLAQLQTLLQLAPSSVNSQPWHFIFAGSSEAKVRIAQAGAHDQYVYNGPKITRASHLVILCVRTDLSEAHLAAVLEQEAADGRFPMRWPSRPAVRCAPVTWRCTRRRCRICLTGWRSRCISPWAACCWGPPP